MGKPILRRIREALVRQISPTEVEQWQDAQLTVFAVGTGIGIQIEFGGYKNVTTILPAASAQSLMRSLQVVIAQAEVNARQGH